jgi:hypothetical protein
MKNEEDAVGSCLRSLVLSNKAYHSFGGPLSLSRFGLLLLLWSLYYYYDQYFVYLHFLMLIDQCHRDRDLMRRRERNNINGVHRHFLFL